MTVGANFLSMDYFKRVVTLCENGGKHENLSKHSKISGGIANMVVIFRSSLMSYLAPRL